MGVPEISLPPSESSPTQSPRGQGHGLAALKPNMSRIDPTVQPSLIASSDDKEKRGEHTRSILHFNFDQKGDQKVDQKGDQSNLSSRGTVEQMFLRFSMVSKLSKIHRHKGRQGRTQKSRRVQELKPYVEYLSKAKIDHLKATVKQLMTPGLGILAADDSVGQLGNRLKELTMDNSETNRRRYHEMLFGGDVNDTKLQDYISGVLVREESITQLLHRGRKLSSIIKERNVALGVRLDKRVVRLDGTNREYITHGLDTLTESYKKLREHGARFALWRCVFRVSEFTPSRLALVENTITLAKFAVFCQQAGLVPIVAPEVLTEGNYGYEEAQAVLREVLTTLVRTFSEYHVYLPATVVRIRAAAPGECFKGPTDLSLVAAATIKTLNQCLPPAIGGVFLARDEDLCKSVGILDHLQKCRIKKPFFVSFCYSLVIQEGVASVWAGQDKNLDKARAELMKRAKLCSLAAMGDLSYEIWSLVKVEASY